MNTLATPLPRAPDGDPGLRARLPHRHGLDLLNQLLKAGYLEILTRDGEAEPSEAAEAPASLRTALMLDGDVIVQVSHGALAPELWEQHQALIAQRLRELHGALRLLTALAIGGSLGLFLGLVGLLQLFEAFRFTGLDVTAASSWGLHALLPLAIPAAITLLLRVALRIWLKRHADRVFGKLRL